MEKNYTKLNPQLNSDRNDKIFMVSLTILKN